MNIGYLGFGAMGSAMAEGFAKYAPAVKNGEITQYAYAPHAEKLSARASEIGRAKRYDRACLQALSSGAGTARA